MASANVNLEKIPTNTRKPGVYAEWNTKLAVRNLPTNKQRVLTAAQHNNPTLGEPTELESVFSAADATVRYGVGDMAHLMVTAAIKTYAYTDLSLTTVTDNKAGVTAAGEITLSGTANTQGVLRVSIANTDTLAIDIGAGDTIATVTTAVKAAIDAVPNLPVTATVTEAVMTLVAKNRGTTGNTIRIRTNSTAEGITTAVTAMTGGDANPDIATALNTVVAEGRHIITCNISDETNLLKLCAHLDAIASPMEGRWAAGVYDQIGTLAQATTLAGHLNHGHIVNVWYRDTPSLPCEPTAAFTVVMASEENPAHPLNTLVLNSIGVCESKNKTIRTEQENALYNDVTPIETGPADTQTQIMRAIATYAKTANGTTDESLLDVTTMRTLIYVSRTCVDHIALRFPRNKLNGRTPPRVCSEPIDISIRCEELKILGRVEENLSKLIVERDLQNTGMSNRRIPSDVINGLHIVDMVVDLYL